MKHWYNNGIITKYCEECPEGFIPGRINKKLNAAEAKNKDEINKVLQQYTTEQISDYYKTHNKAETAEYFNINQYVLIQLLKTINYDFSYKKESKFKGKSAARSHESYIAAGQKSAETQKQHWSEKSEEEKLAWSTKQSLAHLNSPTFKEKITISNKAYRNSLTQEERNKMDLQRSKTMQAYWENLSEDEKDAVMANRFKNGCSYNQKDSGPNISFKNLLETNGINISDREYCLDKKLFDFRIDNILIEINPTITHNSTFTPFKYNSPADKNYHLEKTQIANKYNFRCIHVFDWDNQNALINLLKSNREQIYARQCEVKIVPKQEAIDFICLNHIQGYAGDKIRLGLYFESELVSIMTFDKPRYNKNYEYELVRYCSSKNIIGGAEKLLRHFLDQYNAKSIISYCDLSKFSGQTYEKLGFKLLRKSGPSKHWYNIRTKEHYTDNLLRQRGFSQLIHKKSAEEDNLVGADNSTLMIQAGFVEVYDCGQATFVLDNTLRT